MLFWAMLYIFSSLLLFFFLFFLIVGYLSGFSNGMNLASDCRSWSVQFECGFMSQGSVENYFSSSYFLMLVFFVLFDLEVSLLLNMPFQGILFKNFLGYLFFLFCLCLGYGLEIESGYVGWLN